MIANILDRLAGFKLPSLRVRWVNRRNRRGNVSLVSLTRPLPVARGPVFGAAASVGLVLTVFSRGYGLDRDELYFLALPVRWGYVDQGPLTPFLAHAMTHLLGDSAWAVRLPATASVMLTVLVVALIARELGGGRGAQALAAWAFAFAALPIAFGHVIITGTVDLPVWPLVLLFLARAVLRDDGRWWLAVGLVVGVSTYNKLLIVVLCIALIVGVLLVGPRSLLVSRWVLAAGGVAVVVGLPNLVYQVSHGWPELAIGRALSDHNSADVRLQMWPFLALLLGPPLVPVWCAGLVHLWRTRALRFVAMAFPVLLALTFFMGSQPYYPLGLVSFLFAVGCEPGARWLAARTFWRRLMIAGVLVNAGVGIVLGLPVVPVTRLGSTPVSGVNMLVQDSVGWPQYVHQIAAVWSELSPSTRDTAIVYASNYGEAGAIDRFGHADGLPAAYSGQNQFWYERRPPAGASTAVLVGGQFYAARGLFETCTVWAYLDNGVDVGNEEQGEPVAVCRNPKGGWSGIWPKLRHFD